MFRKAIRSFFVFMLVFGLFAIPAPPPARAAGPWHVATTGDDGNDCLSPGSPCATINGAIGKASDGDTVYIAEGTYTGAGSEVILIDRDVALSGGWDATFAGQSGTTFVDGETVRRSVTVNAGTTSSLDRFILLNGNKTGGGGGINNSGTLTLSNLTISDNRWGIGDGGGIANNPTGVITMNNTALTRNGNQDLCNGTAIWNQGAITANNSTIFDNQVTQIFCGIGSAVINHTGDGYRGSIVLNNTTVSNNSPGGGIYNYGDLILNNSTVSHNVGDDSNGPGGIYNSVDGILSINSSTIADNTSAGSGGGIFNIGFGTGSVTLQNSIIAGNLAASGPDCFGVINSLGYNLVGNTTDCNFSSADGDLTDMNAKLGILVGSPAYRPLLPDSPAVDAGRPTGCTDQDGNLLATDQRGVARVGACDMGAYEFTAPGPASSLSIIGGNHQRTLVMSPYPGPFQVVALDGLGSPVEGVTVDFSAPDSGPSGTFTDTGTLTTSAITDASGVAVSATFTANDQAGIYQVSASADGAGFAHFSLEQVDRPANDDFENAEVISTLPFNDTVDITDATKESGELFFCTGGPQSQSVWYSFTPETTGVVSADMAGSSFNDTNIAVFQATGPGLEGLSLMSSSCFGGSLSFTAEAGTTYYFLSERLFGGGGELHVNLQGFAAPANDNFANAVTISSLPFSATVDNTGATAESGEPQNCGFPFRSVWYSFTPGEDMALRVDMAGSALGGTVGIFLASGPAITDLTSLGCASTNIPVNFQTQAGQTYYLKLDSFFGQAGGLQINLQQITPPANDDFANAEAISSLPFSVTVDNTDATTEPGEPQDCGKNSNVWYVFTPMEDMTVQVDMIGSAVPGLVSVFSGSDLSNLTTLACVFFNSSTNLQLQAGQTYYLRVQAEVGQIGSVQVNLQQITPPANDRFANAEVINALPFNASGDNSNATVEPGEAGNCGFPYRSVWYTFTPPQDVAVRLSINGATSVGFAGLFLASGPSISDLTFLRCTSVGNPANSLLEAGQTYYVRVDTFFGQPGEFQISLEQITPPGNDNFAGAQVITALPFNTSVDNSDATVEPGEPAGCGSSSRSVWYSFTPTETIQARLNAAGSAVSATISVFLAAGPEMSDISFLTCTGSFSTNLMLEGGQTYYLQVDSFGQGGVIQVNLEQLNPPANDNLANAEMVIDLPFSVTVNIMDATIEPDEPQICLSMLSTVWYAFTPAETVLMRANTLGSPISSNVNIYGSTGTGLSDLQFINCSGSSGNPSFLAEAGKTYYFQVGSTFGESGSVHFNLQPVLAPANDNFADAVDISSLPFSAVVDVTDASLEPDEPQFCFSTSDSIWYSLTATETVTLRTDTQGSVISANVTVYHSIGEGFPGLQILQCSGFGSATAFTAEAGETYYFQVGSIGQGGPLQFNLAQAGSISGSIVDSLTSAPLPGLSDPFAGVELFRVCGENCLEFINSQQTDENGQFSFAASHFGAPLLPGDYEVRASAQFYQPGQFGPFAFSDTDLDLGDLPLVPTSVIRGRVVDAESREPLPGASVVLYRCDPSGCFEFVNSQSADENGQFRFNSFHFGSLLGAGNYELQIFAAQHVAQNVQVTIADGEDRDIGDVLLDLIPFIGSISGRLLDAVTGTPILPEFLPNVELYLCNDDGCTFVNAMTPDGQGEFRFETDFSGNPLPVGNYQVSLFADQYLPAVANYDIGEGVHHDLGDVLLESFPVRFSEVQHCDEIPALGGECEFSVRVTNGTTSDVKGRVWNMATVGLPSSLVGYSLFQVKDPQDLDLGAGRSKVFRFRLRVPENNSPDGASVCSVIFVGEGSHALFNTIGERQLFCIIRNGAEFEFISPQDVLAGDESPENATISAVEVEPNNSCQTAQEMGMASEPSIVNGSLDSFEAPDIDFFRFTGTPGTMVLIDHEGEPTGRGTLGDPLLGFFDSNCALIDSNDDSGTLNSHLDITVPEDGVYILAATAYPDFNFVGGGFGSYQLTVTPVQYLSSISGVITDAMTGAALPGDASPFAFIRLLRCGQFGCSEVNFQNAGSDGGFQFTTDFGGNALQTGEYILVAAADQYQVSQSEIFTVSQDEDYNAGNVELHSYPIRFSDIQVCAVPFQGGLCDFSVRVTNGLSTKFAGKAWSIIDGYQLGSFVNYTAFQADTSRDITLDPGRSMVLRFRFQVRAAVAEGAIICTSTFAGQNPNPLYNTVGLRFLFCFQKGSEGFTLMSQPAILEQAQHWPANELIPASPRK